MVKNVFGYEEYYTIDINGNVYSKRFNKYLKHDISKSNGIRSVKITGEDNKPHRISVIRLLALTFIKNENPTLYNYAININGNQNDTNVNNVMWGTSSMQVNSKYKRLQHLKKAFIDSSVPINTRKMSDNMVADLKKMKELGYSIKQLTKIFPIKKSQIHNLLTK